MEILNLKQGSEEWKKARLDYFTASEAPVIMGCMPTMSRDDLLTYKTTKNEKEVSDFVQKFIFSKGHEAEAAARAILESDINDELYPVTGSIVVDGLDLLASFDGLAMDGAASFEHKLWNKEKAENLQSLGEPEPMHYWQLEQQLLVSGANSVIFVMSDGTKDNWVKTEYKSIPERRAELIAAWKQFAKDLEGYEPKVYQEKPEAAPVKDLPAITYKLDGLALTSNIEAYKEAAQQLVEDSKKPLETDQDFADAEALNKKFKDAEAKIKLIQGQILGEIEDVDKFSKDIGFISGMFRQARLNQEKLVSTRKEQIKTEIYTAAKKELDAFLDVLGNNIKLDISEDLTKSMRGKKTKKSLNEAANDAVARGKIEATKINGVVLGNIKTYKHLADDKAFLFNDLNSLLQKDSESFEAIIKSRLAEYDEMERKKEAEIAEKARVKAELDAAEKVRDAAAKADTELRIQEVREAKKDATLLEDVKKEVEPDIKSKNPDLLFHCPKCRGVHFNITVEKTLICTTSCDGELGCGWSGDVSAI